MLKLRPVILLAMLLTLASASFLPSAGPTVAAAAQTRPPGATALVPDHARVTAALESTPVMFVENGGQLEGDARFQVRTGNGAIYLAEDAIWFTARERPAGQLKSQAQEPRSWRPEAIQDSGSFSQPGRGVNLKVSFPGANPSPTMEAFNLLETRISYFIGNDPAKWRAGLPVWGGVRYVDLYPGIDLEVMGEGGRLVQRVVSRGGDLGAVRMRVDGADSLAVVGRSLEVATAAGAFTLPLLQVTGDGSHASLLGEPRANGLELTAPFAIGSEPRPRTTASGSFDLSYATFLGGSGRDWARGIAVDGSGAAYLTGISYPSDFPTTAGAYDMTYNGGYIDAFVAKLNPAGSALVYAAFLGGSNGDAGNAIAVDGSGAGYATGYTQSTDFPTTLGAYDTTNGPSVAFVTKLDPTGSTLVYSTFLGGSVQDSADSIALDESGAAYITGGTTSADFPTTPGAYDMTINGGQSAFITKLNPAGSDLEYSTFLGGSGTDTARGIAVDGIGAAYVTVYAASSDFPTTPGAYDTTFNGVHDVAAVKLNPAGSALVYSTFVGGSNEDAGFGMAVDGSGAAYITGTTLSSDFPTTPGAYDTSFNGNGDVFLSKLDPAGSALVYSTFLGGSNDETGAGIAVDGSGAAYLTGYVVSSNFPTTLGAYDTSYNAGPGDGFVAKVDPTGSALVYSTFLGGTNYDTATAIAIDGSGTPYVAGLTYSSDFPATSGAYDTSYNGGPDDAFVAKLFMPEPSPDPCGLTYGSAASIGADTTWDMADSPVCIRSVVTVFMDVTLTVNPGVVVKFGEGGTTLVVNGTLSARGTNASRIYFTSDKDDTLGGDTNGDGSATVPAKGDWRGVYFNGGGGLQGTGDLDYVEVRYGGSAPWNYGNLVVQYTDRFTMTNSILRESASYGARIESASGPVSIVNSLVTGSEDSGFFVTNNAVTIHSTDLVNNASGLFLFNIGGSVIRNTLVVGNGGNGVLLAGGPEPAFENNNVWGNNINYVGIGDQTDVNGNISADPLFVSSATGDYHLGPGSPAIDNGTATGAPATDMDGDTRPQGARFDMGFDERQQPTADLAVAKTGTPNPMLVGQPLTYTVTITNNGPSAATGVVLTDTLPAGVTFGSVASNQGSCAQSVGIVNCALGSLANGATITATIVVTPTLAGAITNTAMVSASEYDPNLANNTVNVATTVTVPPMNQLFFGDDFDGTTLDSSKWNVTLATSGRRWCADGYSLFNSGLWVDASASPCYGTTQAAPYGAITVGGGAGSYAAPYGRAFPYVWHGPPSMLSPFPSNGDFALEVRIRYDSITNAGTGVWAANWPNTEPEGNNPPSSLAGDIFGVWADSIPGPRTWLFGDVKPIPVSDGLYHVFRFEYRNGAYSAFMDDALLAGPAASAVRPNALWIGNPGFEWWSVDDWTDFTVDYLRVFRPPSETAAPVVSGVSLAPNPAINTSPATLAASATDPTPATYVARAEWFDGADPGLGNGAAMAAADGAFDSPTEALTATVYVAGWAIGAHTISVRAQDAADNWSWPVTATLTVLPVADLAVALIGAPNPGLVGQPLTYTVTVANNGPSPATGVVVTDTLPAGVTFASASSNQGSCFQAAGVVNCSLGGLTSGGGVTVTVVVTPTVAGTITNTATVLPTEADPNPNNNTATVATTVVPLPNGPGATTRVSVASDGTQGNSASRGASVSANARFVAFSSEADNLVAGDSNNQADLFVQDRQTGQTSRVSVASNSSQGNGGAALPSISADGRYVSFRSDASNLVAGDNNGAPDIFVHDRQSGQTERVSVATDGTQGDEGSFGPSISADGRYVAFSSNASTLVAGDTNFQTDIFVHDRQTGQTTRVSVASDGTQGNRDGFSREPSISADGRYVAFESSATNLVPDDTNGTWDVFVHDRQTGQTTRVSMASDGSQANAYGVLPSISADGRYVAFESAAGNLVTGDTNGAVDIFVHDRQTGQTMRVSVSSDGAQGNRASEVASISPNGRYVAFESEAENLVQGDTNGNWDIFVYDRQTGRTTRASVASDGTQTNGSTDDSRHSRQPSVSADGQYVAFESDARNLVAADTNGARDVFVRDRGSEAPPEADLAVTKTASPNPVLLGQPLIYTVAVTNNGPSPAAAVTVTDTLPAGVSFGSASTPAGGICFQSGGTVNCGLGSLASGSTATVTVVVTPTLAGAITNTATAWASEDDPTPANNTAATVTTVSPSADLLLTKTAAPNPALVGAPLTYTIAVTNNGPSPAATVTVTDTLPNGVTFGSASTPAGGICFQSGGTVNCGLGSLASGSTATVTVVVTPTLAGAITNTATASASEDDPFLANNTATAVTNAVVPPQLTLVKSVINDNGGTAAATAWTLTATGTGGSPTNLSGTTPVGSGPVFKADTYTLAESGGPSGYTASAWSCPGFTVTGGNQITVGLGQSATCTITNDDVAAPGSFPSTGVLDNFNRADGALGANWNAFFYRVLADQAATTSGGGNAVWLPTTFGPSQEAYATLTNLSSLNFVALDLKLNGANPDLSTSSLARVAYFPATSVVQAQTRVVGGNFVNRASTVVAFAGGDTFGARLLANGVLSAYKNGVLILTNDLNAGPNPWPAALVQGGGRIALQAGQTNSGVPVSRFDNFGGGTVPSSDVPPQLTLTKSVINDNGGTAAATAWTLTATGTGVSPTNLSGATPVVSGPAFKADTYTLAESGGPSGYTAGAWACPGFTLTGGNQITLAPGDSATCTIASNDSAPQLTLVKTVTNDNGGTAAATAWTLTATGTGGSPTNLSGATPVVSGPAFKADTYALAESGGPPGYAASAWTCPGFTLTGGDQITLGLGQSATCTITNDDAAPGSFPSTGVLDNFNRADGTIGANWNAFFYSVLASQAATTSAGGNAVWLPTTFGPSQEAYVTLANLSALNFVALDLKLNGANPDLSTSSLARVVYFPATSVVQAQTRVVGGNFVNRTSTVVDLAGGDTLGARLLANGVLTAYKNGVLILTVDLTAGPNPWPAALVQGGGRVGLQAGQTSSGVPVNRFDNFGGGAVPSGEVAPQLTLTKSVINDNGGTAAPTAWTLTATGTGVSPTNLSGTTPVVSGPAFQGDTYTLAESGGPSGYTAGAWSCPGFTLTGGNQITLVAGQSVTCTITNDDAAPGTFPSTGILDNFNRADGTLGANWNGFFYRVLANQAATTSGGGNAIWLPTTFGPSQEAYATLTNLSALNFVALDLKLNGPNPDSNTSSLVRVLYFPATNVVRVQTRVAGGNFVNQLSTVVAFAAGDTLGARLLASGVLTVYKNGAVILTNDLTTGANPWPATLVQGGGRIGLQVGQLSSGVPVSRFDNFGGGNGP